MGNYIKSAVEESGLTYDEMWAAFVVVARKRSIILC